MKETIMDLHQIAQMIDLSAVQTENDETYVRKLVDTAINVNCIAVFTLPSWILFTKSLLGSGTRILLGGPVGFPAGGNTTKSKVFETCELIKMGCSEIDVVINVGKLLSGHYKEVYDDIRAVVEAADKAPVKVIIECHYLSEKDILKSCDIVIESGASWVKTGTGWTATGATVENIRLISDHVGNQVKIKAAGGIRDLATLLQLYNLGARRFGLGLNSALSIIDELTKKELEEYPTTLKVQP